MIIDENVLKSLKIALEKSGHSAVRIGIKGLG